MNYINGACLKLSPKAKEAALHAIDNECRKSLEHASSIDWRLLFKLVNVQKESFFLSNTQQKDLLTALEHYPEAQESATAIVELYPQIKKDPDLIS